MEESITLSQIGLYNPQRVSDSVSEALFVVRKKQLKILLDSICHEKSNSIPQHHLVIAQRGMGKTTLLKRIEVELRKEEWNKMFIPLLLPEEQYNVKNLAEFWLNCIDVLADVMDREKNTMQAKAIDERVLRLMEIRDSATLSLEAYEYLTEISAELGRRPVLLIDNLNLIFDRLHIDEQHVLRSLMMKNKAPIIIGGSTTYMEGTTNYGAPFYDAFRMHYLERLKVEELIDILINLSHLIGNVEIIPTIQAHTPRIKALHQLTGGNPRTAVMLFRLIVKGFSKDINDDLEALLDEATPIYKARFEELPEQMQIIVDTIALHWDPITLEQLRESTRYENGQLSPQLKRLSDMGWIEKPETSQRKGGAYEMSERFFNIWFLMRRSSRRQKKGVYCLSKFLEAYYGEELNEVAKYCLTSNFTASQHVMNGLALAKAVKDQAIKEQLCEKSRECLFTLSKQNPAILEQFETSDVFSESSISNLLKEFRREFEHENYDAVDLLLSELITQVGDTSTKADLYYFKGSANVLTSNHSNYSKAEKDLRTAIELDSTKADYYSSLGSALRQLGRIDEAEATYIKAIELNPFQPRFYELLGRLYVYELSNLSKAKSAYKKATELEPTNAEYWLFLGNIEWQMKYFEEAEQALKKSLKLKESSKEALLNLGALYFEANRLKEAETLFKKYLKINSRSFESQLLLALLYDHQAEYTKAEAAYLKAIELDTSNNTPKQYLAILYRDEMNRLNDAEELFNSIEIDNNLIDAYWLNKVLFELYKQNLGIATNYLINALKAISNTIPSETQDDWMRFGALVTKLKYTEWLLTQLKENEYDVTLAPYYVAIKAINEKEADVFLDTVAAEIREIAKDIVNKMKAYL